METHLSYVVASNDLCDLENKVKVTWFKHGLHLALVLPCVKFGEDMSNISSDIEQKPFKINLNDLHDLEKKVKVMRFNLILCLALVFLCAKFW